MLSTLVFEQCEQTTAISLQPPAQIQSQYLMVFCVGGSKAFIIHMVLLRCEQ